MKPRFLMAENGAGGGGADWKTTLPDELKNSEALKDVKDVASLAKAFVDTKAYVGSSIRVPGPDAGEEDRKAFRSKLKEKVPDLLEVPSDPVEFAKVEENLFERLGKPKEPKAYPSLKDAKIEVPEGVTIDEEKLRENAHKLGLTKKQFVALAARSIEELSKSAQATAEKRSALRKELGDAYQDRLSAAAEAAKKSGLSDDAVQAIRSGNVPVEHAKAWINVAKSLGTEGTEIGGQGQGGPTKLTPQEAQEQIEEIYRNPALKKRGDPAQARLTQRLYELHKIVHPEK